MAIPKCAFLPKTALSRNRQDDRVAVLEPVKYPLLKNTMFPYIRHNAGVFYNLKKSPEILSLAAS
jgi:hypothetical protein